MTFVGPRENLPGCSKAWIEFVGAIRGANPNRAVGAQKQAKKKKDENTEKKKERERERETERKRKTEYLIMV